VPKSILFADDSAVTRRAVRDLLTAELGDDLIYVEAGSGHEALNKAIALQPDVVLLDIAMPGLNGVETARYIHKACPRAAVLAISSYDIEAIIPRVAVAGIRGFVRKDSMGVKLFPAIQALLEGKTYFADRSEAFSIATGGA
jgi:two-component system, NarL family, response regulator NreC